MTIRINPDVFNTHKAYDDLLVSAQDGSERLDDFAHKLVKAADIHDNGPRAYFQIIEFNMGEDAETVSDFGIYAQNVINDDGDVNKTALLDMSFGVHKDQFHLMQSACMVRYDSSLTVDPDTGALTLQRPNPNGMLVGTDHIDDLGNNLFSWIFDRIPEDDRDVFMRNCEEMGLINTKPTIGFGTMETQQSVEVPSVH